MSSSLDKQQLGKDAQPALPKVDADDDKQLSRRNILGITSLAFGSLLAACGGKWFGKSTRFTSPTDGTGSGNSDNSEVNKDVYEQTNIDDDPTPTPTPDPIVGEQDCDPLDLDNQVNLSQIPDASGANVPLFKFYGDEKDSPAADGSKLFSFMFVAHFNQYDDSVSNKLTSVSVVKSSGMLIASHYIGAADRKTASQIRPLVFNGLTLAKDQDLYAVMTYTDNSQLKFKMDRTVVKDDSTFNGMTVPMVSLSFTSVPSNSFTMHQAVPNIDGSKPTYNYAPDEPKYQFALQDGSGNILPGQYRLLKTCRTTTSFSAATRLAGYTITDLMGNVIGSGDSFANILEYPSFICYKLVGSTYYRTIISIG